MRILLSIMMVLGLNLSLEGCMSGGSSMEDVSKSYVGFFDTSSLQKSALVGHSLDPSASTADKISGELDRKINRLSIARMQGDINSSRTLTVLDGGGSITISGVGTKYVVRYIAQPTTGNPTFGVIGSATKLADIPTGGGASYSGGTQLQIIDGQIVYDLAGALSMVADFTAGSISLDISNLNGTKIDGTSVPTSITNVATINISGNISNNGFSGKNITMNSTELVHSLTGSQTLYAEGHFFGPSADEIGGVILVDDSVSGSAFVLQGTFIGER